MAKQHTAHTVHETASFTDRTILENLYTANYGTLVSIAGENPAILPEQPDAIASGIAHHLDEYPGELSQTAYREWSEGGAAAAREFLAIRNQYAKYVYAGIGRMFRGYTDLIDKQNRAVKAIEQPLSTADHIAQITWVWAFENLDSLLALDQPAQIGTRLNAKAYWFARTWITHRLRAKLRFSDLSCLDKPVKQAGGQFIFPAAEAEATEPELAILDAPKRKRRSKMDDPGPDWGKPIAGIFLLCPNCKDLNKVMSVDGYISTLACGHTRAASIDGQSALQRAA
jgi:hypothetical protein